MTIKESSDDLKPHIVKTGAAIAHAPSRRTALDYLALVFATWGVGYIPIAPGTWGSLLAVGIYRLFDLAYARLLPLPPLSERNVSTIPAVENLRNLTAQVTQLRTLFLFILVALLTWLGVWAASRVESLLGRKDPGIVIVDEIAGQLIALLFLPFNANLWLVIAGFLLFRLFDIWKPYPIRKLEALPAGLGIMADDILAGVYAAILLSLVTAIYLLF